MPTSVKNLAVTNIKSLNKGGTEELIRDREPSRIPVRRVLRKLKKEPHDMSPS